MLDFFRKNSKVIGWVIISFFAVTMFAGTMLVRGFWGTKSTEVSQEDRANAVAFLGEDVITSAAFEEAVNQIVSRVDLQKAGGRLSPDLQELVQFNALNQVVNNMVLLKGAEDARIKVSGQEMDQAIQGVVVQYDLRDEKALKALLKKNGKDYGDFKDSIEESVKLQKFVESLKNSVTVTNQDVENEFTDLHVRHILFRVSKQSEDSDKKKLAESVSEQLAKGLPFEEAVSKFSDDMGTRSHQGDIGWVSFGATVPSFEAVAYALPVGKISQPVKTNFGYHIIQVLEKRGKNRPTNINFDAEKQRILAKKQDNVVQAFIQQYLIEHPLSVQYSPVAAYRAKMEGDYQKALGEYQLMISRNPYNPVPHYFIGQIYMMIQDQKQALEEFKKGEVKMDLNPQVVLPELYLALGDAYEKSGDTKGLSVAYKKAFENVKTNPVILRQLIPVFEKKKMAGLASEAQAQIAILEKAQKQSLAPGATPMPKSPEGQE